MSHSAKRRIRVTKSKIKRCGHCKEKKPLIGFNKDANTRSGLQSSCKECHRERVKQYYLSKHGTTYNRAKHLKTRFNLTLKQYDEIAVKQNNVCAICKQSESRKGKPRLAVDHDHKTGKIRSLLCDRCNRLLGNAKDNISLLAEAIQYLRRFQ